ncbi:hypothetical protein HU200_036028 [Digitaria exilis]|uniref:Uncharacterized protein n=1 Tax=Digitaria exilis TaxID=1010633 RepID=A0A835BGW5_9POAL|nr:hypothetical protein HU200_036028 [Digitaria exilis]
MYAVSGHRRRAGTPATSSLRAPPMRRLAFGACSLTGACMNSRSHECSPKCCKLFKPFNFSSKLNRPAPTRLVHGERLRPRRVPVLDAPVRHKYWEVYTSTTKKFDLGEALDLNATLRQSRQLGDLLSLADTASAVGKWYSMFFLVKEAGVAPREQMECSA